MKGKELITLNSLLTLASLVEIATGLALMICPSFIAQWLLNSGLAGASIAIGRIAGFGLFSLGISCWPNRQMVDLKNPALLAMLIYGVLITIYLVYLGVESQWVGWMLWPAAFFHAVLTSLLAFRASNDEW